MVVEIDTLFTSTVREAAPSTGVSLMVQLERSFLKITLGTMAKVTRHFPAQNLQYQLLKFGLEEKSDVTQLLPNLNKFHTYQTPIWND